MIDLQPTAPAPRQCWPVGLRLRFKQNAITRRPYFEYLRGTPVLVLSDPEYFEESDDWRQQVSAFGALHPEHQVGWARPEQLEYIPDQPASLQSWASDTLDLHTDHPQPRTLVEEALE